MRNQKKNIRKNSSKDNWKIIFDDFSYFFFLFFNFFLIIFSLSVKNKVLRNSQWPNPEILPFLTFSFLRFFFFFFFKNCCTFRIADDLRQLDIMNRIRKEEKVQRKWKKILEIFQTFLCHLSNQFNSIRFKSVLWFDRILSSHFFSHVNNITHPKFPSGIPPTDPYWLDEWKDIKLIVCFRY